MRRMAVLFAALAAALLAAPAAQADFGLHEFDLRFSNANGSAATQAGSHPFAVTTSFLVNNHEEPLGSGKFFADGGDIRDLLIEAAQGLVADTTAIHRCTAADFIQKPPACPLDTAVGATATLLTFPDSPLTAPVYNLVPPPGVALRLGFITADVPVVVDAGIKQAPDYNALAEVTKIPQPLTVFGAVTELWGVPADPRHDFARGEECLGKAVENAGGLFEVIKEGRLNLVDSGEAGDHCPAGVPERPLFTLPRACRGPLPMSYSLDPWNDPGAFTGGSLLTHDEAGPAGFAGCTGLEFIPSISSTPSTDSAASGSGLDFELDFEDEIDHAGEGLVEPDGIAQSDLKKAVITLPEGVTANPSLAEGLQVCTPADLDRETASSAPGAGCPAGSKIGSVGVETPLVNHEIVGDVYIAQADDPATSAPGAENPFDTLLAFYIVLKDPELGVSVKVPAKVEPDPATGQLVTTVDDTPQIPFSRFSFHFREGQRAPLITPSGCGTYTTTAKLTPWARPNEPVTRTASFQITRGAGGSPCPPAGAAPFNPGFEAGSLNNAAGRYSPFTMRLTRADGEQDLTRFDATLPPGLTGKLAGVGECPEAAIALARAKTGVAERAAPSCPEGSRIGQTLAAAGVGSALTYVPGSLYLAGPYHGAPLSVVAITPAVAGPFDAGAVVVRQALRVDPRSAVVSADGSASDPIPHILKGIPLNVRDIRVRVDRSEFTLNPTSCQEKQTRAEIFGSNLDLLNPADDIAHATNARYQAAACAGLAFHPRLALHLTGGTRRGGHPAFRAIFRPRPGQANSSGLVLRFPRSAFLEQAHIRTICTRVQFAAKACPDGSVYGQVTAFTPLLEKPLRGPVYLRSSSHKLPDFVFDLHGRVDFEAVARTDSIHGGIRVSVEGIPDAPISKVVVRMQGGDKGLIVNSRDICADINRANVDLSAHNGRRVTLRPELRAQC